MEVAIAWGILIVFCGFIYFVVSAVIGEEVYPEKSPIPRFLSGLLVCSSFLAAILVVIWAFLTVASQ